MLRTYLQICILSIKISPMITGNIFLVNTILNKLKNQNGTKKNKRSIGIPRLSFEK